MAFCKGLPVTQRAIAKGHGKVNHHLEWGRDNQRVTEKRLVTLDRAQAVESQWPEWQQHGIPEGVRDSVIG